MQYTLTIPPEIGAGLTAVMAAALAAIAAWLKSKKDPPEKKPASLDDVVRLLTDIRDAQETIRDRQERHGEILLRLEDRTRGQRHEA